MNDETREEAAAWLSKAKGDLLAAQTLAAPQIGQRDIAIYHCQQPPINPLVFPRESPLGTGLAGLGGIGFVLLKASSR